MSALSIWKQGHLIRYPMQLGMKADSHMAEPENEESEYEDDTGEKVIRTNKVGFPDLYIHWKDQIERILEARDYCLLS